MALEMGAAQALDRQDWLRLRSIPLDCPPQAFFEIDGGFVAKMFLGEREVRQ